MTDDDHTYRTEPDPAFADRLERELLGRLASPSNSTGVVADQDLPEDVQLVRLADPDQPAVENERARSARWLAAAAVLVLVVAAVVLVRNAGDGEDAPVDVVPTTTSEAGGPTTLAKGEDVEIDGFESEFYGRTLNIDAVEEDGEVTGEFRVDNVVVTLECADTRQATGVDSTGRDLILGGEVTEDPDGQGLLVEPGKGLVVDPGPGRYVAVGDVVALIIREGDEGDEGAPERDSVTLYDSRAVPQGYGSAGSCTELVESVPGDLDGGFFNPVAFGHHIDTGGGNCDPCDDDSSTTTIEAADNDSSTLARAEDVELVGDALATVGGFGGQTLNISAATEEDGDVTGEFRVDDVVVRVECANTDIDGVVILAGEITADPTGMLSAGQLLILVIREGDPDSVALATSGRGIVHRALRVRPRGRVHRRAARLHRRRGRRQHRDRLTGRLHRRRALSLADRRARRHGQVRPLPR